MYCVQYVEMKLGIQSSMVATPLLCTCICHACAFCVHTSLLTFNTLICVCRKRARHGPVISDMVRDKLSEVEGGSCLTQDHTSMRLPGSGSDR